MSAAVGGRDVGRALVALVLLAVVAVACEPASQDGGQVDLSPHPIDDQEGAVCGMLLRDQPAPRAQLVHRNGERAFLCSIADLLAYLEVPSPHGAPVAILLEAMEPDADPRERRTGAHPWVPASEAVFVVGVPRERIMGEPVLVYRDSAAAARAAAGHHSARVLDFDGLTRWWAERPR